MLFHLISFKLAQIAAHLKILFQTFIYCKNGKCIFLFIPYAYRVQIRNIAVIPAVINRCQDLCIQYRSATENTCVHVWIKNSLTPCTCIGSHDRCDNIYKLCQAGHFHTVRMTEQCDQHTSYQKGILKIIDILQLVWRLPPFFQFLIRFIAVIPYIPLIKGQMDPLFGMLLRTHCVADADYAGDEIIHSLGICKKIRRVICSIAIILMQRHVINQIVTFVQNCIFPVSESRHAKERASTGNRLDLRIQHFHNTGGLRCCPSIFICSLVSHLPWTIHFISQAPGLNVVRLCMAVGLTHVAVIGTALKITVFQKVSGFLRSSCSKIHCHHNICVCFLRPVHKLVQAKVIVLDHTPGKFRSGRS